MTPTPLLVPLSLFGGLHNIISTMLQPLYWAVSGLLVLFHKLWTPAFGSSSGWTWALSIISLTVFIRILLIPLFVRQINSSRQMQMMQPKIKALQEKHGADRQKLSEETMKLYREEGVNPAASCLPLLLQSPIFISLYRVLEGASHSPTTARGHWFKVHPELVQSLHNSRIFGASLADRFLPMHHGFGATQVLAMCLIIGMSFVLYLTQLQLLRKNMPPEALTGPMAQQQKTMLYVMPIMYLFMGINIPIGVLIYWLTTNVWTMGQQYIIIHNNPAPNTPAYVDWQERMRRRGKDPEALEAARVSKRRRTTTTTTAPATVVDDDGTERAVVARQGVVRSTSRPAKGATAAGSSRAGAAGSNGQQGGRQVVNRQQPNRQTRQARKKK